ncbi:MAG: SusC/RagA family TonB-linked outer membrane protein, partial [Nonlabens ulvanivorans]
AYSRVYDSQDQTVWHQVEEGGRIGDLYGTGYLRNENGDFVLTADGRFIADPELKKLGNYNADFTMGFNNSFTYKNWDASFLLDWRQGGILVSRTLALAAVGGQLEETANRPDAGIVANGVVNTGTADNPVYVQNTTAVSAESYYRQFYDRNHEENNVYDASYLKLRQFSIGYSFDLNKGALGLFNDGAEMRVSLIGRNLFAFSEIPHFDPEQLAVQGQGFVSGVEDMSYASTRSIGIKAGIQF